LQTVADLCHFPITTYEDLTSAIAVHGVENLLAEPSAKWWQTTGTTGKPKIFHNSARDLDLLGRTSARGGYFAGIDPGPGTVVLNAGAGEPWTSSSLAHLACAALGVTEIQVPIFDEADVVRILAEALRIGRIDAVFGVPLFALVLRAALDDPPQLQRRLERELSGDRLADALAWLPHLRSNELRTLFAKTSIGVFGGASPAGFLHEIREVLPNAAIIDAYGAAEMGIVASEFEPGGGLRPFLDMVIMEVAPFQDMADWRAGKCELPHTLLPTEWYVGLEGELLATPGTTGMPKIRVAIGDIVRVVQPAQRTRVRGLDVELPVIKILGRREDAIAIGTKLLFASDIVEALNRVHTSGQAKWWDIYIGGTKARLDVIPVVPVDQVRFTDETRRELLGQAPELEPLWVGGDFVIDILPPDAYQRIEAAINQRKREGRPLGQLKPSRVHLGESI